MLSNACMEEFSLWREFWVLRTYPHGVTFELNFSSCIILISLDALPTFLSIPRWSKLEHQLLCSHMLR